MNREQMYKKYQLSLLEMHRKTGDDNGVCLDKLIYENNVKHGRIERTDTYVEIPSNFNFNEFEKDYQQLIAK
ncbi:MAG: hypothetical protein AB9836_12300 [Aminipila sp.]